MQIPYYFASQAFIRPWPRRHSRLGLGDMRTIHAPVHLCFQSSGNSEKEKDHEGSGDSRDSSGSATGPTVLSHAGRSSKRAVWNCRSFARATCAVAEVFMTMISVSRGRKAMLCDNLPTTLNLRRLHCTKDASCAPSDAYSRHSQTAACFVEWWGAMCLVPSVLQDASILYDTAHLMDDNADRMDGHDRYQLLLAVR